MTETRNWKVGELAAATGLTVRTLHHYDQIGLLRPSRRTAAGHRLYVPADVTELYRIIALRQLGLGLDRIPEVLRGGVDPRTLLAEQIAYLDRQLEAGHRFRTQLSAVLATLRESGPPVVDDLIRLIQGATTAEQALAAYLTDEQIAAMGRRYAQLGPAADRAVTVEFPELYLRAQAELDAGTAPADLRVQAIVARMDELGALLAGGDPEIRDGVRAMWADRGDWRELRDFVDRARAVRVGPTVAPPAAPGPEAGGGSGGNGGSGGGGGGGGA